MANYYITGDIRTSNTPNYGENRIEISSTLIIDMEFSVGVITLKEEAKVIYDAFANGSVIRGKMSSPNGIEYPECVFASNADGYSFVLWYRNDIMTFEAITDNDFPTMEIGG